MRTDRTESEYEELKQLLLETKKVAEETRKYARTTRNYIRLLELTWIVKAIIIVALVVIAAMYAPRAIQKLFDVYTKFIGGTGVGAIIEQFSESQNPSQNILQKAGISENQVQEILKNLQRK